MNQRRSFLRPLPFAVADHDPEVIHELVFDALWGRGPMDHDPAVRAVAASATDDTIDEGRIALRPGET